MSRKRQRSLWLMTPPSAKTRTLPQLRLAKLGRGTEKLAPMSGALPGTRLPSNTGILSAS